MGRRCGLLGLVTAWAACLLTVPGCALHRCDFAPGEAVGLRVACDPHASRVYHCRDCCRPRRDPRIPGPRSVSTLPAQPEMAAPGYFQPVPTYPVFGPRSEEPDGIEPEMQPLMPDDGSMEGETLPEPTEPTDDTVQLEDAEEASDDGQVPSALALTAPGQSVRQTGWKAARKQSPEAAAATRPCAKCTVTFKSPASSQR